MKQSVLILASLIIFGFAATGQKNIELTLEIKGIKSFDKKLYVGLYSSEKDFKAKSNAVDSAIIIPKKKSVTIKMKNLKKGYYAAAGFQDLNGNGKLDTGVFGIPVEPVCVSDYTHKPKSPPTFKKSEFYLTQDTTIVMPLVSGKKDIEKLEKAL